MALRESINPRKLRQEIYALCDALFSLPNAVPGVTEKVHQTLQHPSELEAPIEESGQTCALSPFCPSTYHDRWPEDKARVLGCLTASSRLSAISPPRGQQQPPMCPVSAQRTIIPERKGQARATLSLDRATPVR
jgi:hypothetical protein